MKKTTLFVEPTGGLANRLRVIDSAINFTNEKGSKLYVLWKKNKSCNCGFRHLFKIPKEIFFLFDSNSKFLTRVFWKLIKTINLYPNIFLNNSIFHDEIVKNNNESVLTSYTSFLEKLPKKSSVFITTCSRFYVTSDFVQYSAFKPIPALQKEINKFYLKDVVGVHIRRTDNQKSILNSPFEGFVMAMEKEVDIDKHVKFFVATDDLDIYHRLSDIFPEKIISHQPRSLDRNDPSGVQDALIDLYCLANCRKIIGSYWSSFTDVAATINRVEKVIITRDVFD